MAPPEGREKSLNSHTRSQDGHDALDYTSLGESRHLKVRVRLPLHLLSRNVGVGAGWGPSLWLAVG